MIRVFLMLFVALVFMCCGRHVTTQTREAQEKAVVLIKVSDTTKIETELVTESSTEYGGTLHTTLYFSKDTGGAYNVESDGLLVKGTLERFGDGYQMKMSAVAKPRTNKTKTTLKTSEQKGLSVAQSTSLESNISEAYKEARPPPVRFISVLTYLIIIIGLLYLLYRLIKNKLIGK